MLRFLGWPFDKFKIASRNWTAPRNEIRQIETLTFTLQKNVCSDSDVVDYDICRVALLSLPQSSWVGRCFHIYSAQWLTGTPKTLLDLITTIMVLVYHCSEILLKPEEVHQPRSRYIGWKEADSWNFTITEMIAYGGRVYCREHIIPVLRTVVSFFNLPPLLICAFQRYSS